MKATVLAPVNIDNEPRAVGDVVEVSAATFRNLVEDGRLGPYVPSEDELEADAEAKADQDRLDAEEQAKGAAAKAEAAAARKAELAAAKAAKAAAKAAKP